MIRIVSAVVEGKRNQPVSVAIAQYSQRTASCEIGQSYVSASRTINVPVASAVTSLNSIAPSLSELT